MRYALVFIVLVAIAAGGSAYVIFSLQASAVAELIELYGERAQFPGHWSVGPLIYCAVMLAGLWVGWTVFSRLFWRRIVRNQEASNYKPSRAELREEMDMPKMSLAKVRRAFFRPFRFEPK